MRNKENYIKMLIKNTCANYLDGNCLLLDNACPLIRGGEYRGKHIQANDCSCHYFENSVLLENPTTEAIYYGKETVLNKVCNGCGRRFNTVSNRAVYCGDVCRKLARKRTHVNYNRKRGKITTFR
jgi:hypothetical protein